MNIWTYKRAVSVIILSFIVITLLSGSCGNTNTTISSTPTVSLASDAWVFPIIPGTEAWAKLESLDEMIEACRVPDDILETMSTPGLVETVLNYPLMGNMVFFSPPQAGFEQIAAQANCVQELYTREDVVEALLVKYRAMDPSAIDDDWTDMQKMQFRLDFTIMETLMSQSPVQTMMTSAQHDEFIALCIEKQTELVP